MHDHGDMFSFEYLLFATCAMVFVVAFEWFKRKHLRSCCHRGHQ